MILADPNMKPTDRYLKSLLQESYVQKSDKRILKLPCGCVNIELEKPQDVSGVCPVCSKPFYLVWQSKPKIRSGM